MLFLDIIIAAIVALLDPLHWIAGLAVGLLPPRRLIVLALAAGAAFVSVLLSLQMASGLQQVIKPDYAAILFLGRTIGIGLIGLLSFELKHHLARRHNPAADQENS